MIFVVRALTIWNLPAATASVHRGKTFMSHGSALLSLVAILTITVHPHDPRPALDPALSYQARKAEPVTYQVDLSFVVTPPYKAEVLKVWVPLPPSDAAQEVSARDLTTFPMKVEPKIAKEPLY